MQSRPPQLLFLGLLQILVDHCFVDQSAVAVGHEELVALVGTDSFYERLGLLLIIQNDAQVLLLQLQKVSKGCASDVGKLQKLAHVVGLGLIKRQMDAFLVPTGIGIFHDKDYEGMLDNDQCDFCALGFIHSVVLLTVPKCFWFNRNYIIALF